MKTLIDKIKQILGVYKKLDAQISQFKKRTGLKCVEGCGRCCENPNVEATELEFFPLAFSFWRKGTIEQWLNKLKQNGKKATCVFYQPDPIIEGKGRCQIYPLRPLICRLYAFSGRRNKHKQSELIGCPMIQMAQPGEFDRAQQNIEDGLKIPIMSDYTMSLYGIDPGLSARAVPINRASLGAFEKIAHLLNLSLRQTS